MRISTQEIIDAYERREDSEFSNDSYWEWLERQVWQSVPFDIFKDFPEES